MKDKPALRRMAIGERSGKDKELQEVERLICERLTEGRERRGKRRQNAAEREISSHLDFEQPPDMYMQKHHTRRETAGQRFIGSEIHSHNRIIRHAHTNTHRETHTHRDMRTEVQTHAYGDAHRHSHAQTQKGTETHRDTQRYT